MGKFAFAVGLIGPILALLVGLVYLTVQIVSGTRHSRRTQKLQVTESGRVNVRETTGFRVY